MKVLQALLVFALLLGCSPDEEILQIEEPGPLVELIGGEFTPRVITINRGETVRWVNRSGSHTVTPDGHTAWEAVVMTGANQIFELQLPTAGEYPYYCEPHAGHGMRGVVIVK